MKHISDINIDSLPDLSALSRFNEFFFEFKNSTSYLKNDIIIHKKNGIEIEKQLLEEGAIFKKIT